MAFTSATAYWNDRKAKEKARKVAFQAIGQPVPDYSGKRPA